MDSEQLEDAAVTVAAAVFLAANLVTAEGRAEWVMMDRTGKDLWCQTSVAFARRLLGLAGLARIEAA